MVILKKNVQITFLFIPIVLVIGMFGFIRTELFNNNQVIFSKALAFDLLVGIPVLYYIVIRQTKINPKSILKVFTICLFVSTILIPESNAEFLLPVKQILYPVIKIWIAFKTIQKLLQLVSKYKYHAKTQSGFRLYSTTIGNTFEGKFGEIILMEFSLLYFLFKGKRKLTYANNEFGYTNNKGTIEMIAAFVFLIVIETIVAHVLISRWNPLIAFLSTYGSLYLVMLFISIIRSRNHFPITIEDNFLKLKYGYVNKSIVKYTDIDSFDVTSKSNTNELMKLSAFKGVENHNIILHFKKPQIIEKVFGVQKKYSSIGVFVDEPIKFISALEEKINSKSEPDGNNR